MSRDRRHSLPALFFMCLVLLPHINASGSEPWREFINNIIGVAGVCREKIDKLTSSLLPSVVQYEVLSDTDVENLTVCCFINITAQQLSYTFGNLSKNFKDDFMLARNISQWLSKICCGKDPVVQCNRTCLRPPPRIVTGCTNNLFEYAKTILHLYEDLTKRDNSSVQDSYILSSLRNHSTSTDLNSCVINLYDGLPSNNLLTSLCSQYLSTASPPPQTSISTVPTTQTAKNEELSTSIKGTTAPASLVTEIRHQRPSITEEVSTAETTHQDVTLSQTATSWGRPSSNTQPLSHSTVLYSQTTIVADGEAGKVIFKVDAKNSKNNTNVLFITAVPLTVIILVIVFFYTCNKIRAQRRTYRTWSSQDSAVHISNSCTDEPFNDL
ncbi:uncharacterized protein LOC132381044 [Hypanus sabinus]|uniref:uncharacterized protein LOC132381044 n=1 Tax=Hypanus sabinus TaxID=79690 RepID=UPI0028C44C25|nr:uncharacterized protein LOC132381044 [Hypanus sabinus]XP_059806142.1 uncharacterized protein LOC132381044 [Hypanus sabinus]XP_059806143.1 uncharacterized protein LOC132381044 [Hypanus sabinus]